MSAVYTLNWKQVRSEHHRMLGPKCYRLAAMKNSGLPVSPFFVLTTEAVRRMLDQGTLPLYLKVQIGKGIGELQRESGLQLDSSKDPLLLAVRSGDPVHLAGALNTFLNVGLNDQTLPALAEKYGDEPAVLRMYLDLLVDFALKIHRVERGWLLPVLKQMGEQPREAGVLRTLITQVRAACPEFTQDPLRQVFEAAQAVAKSWQSPGTERYKESLRLGSELLPSVIIQQMVFSGFTGRAFAAFCTRNPVTGEPRLTGEFALSCPGTSFMRGVVPDRRPIEELDRYFPGTYGRLGELSGLVEVHSKHPQDVEVVIYGPGEFFFTQSVDAILSNQARESTTWEYRDCGILSLGETLQRDEGQRVLAVRTYKLNPQANFTELNRGVPADPGVVWGRLVLSVEAATRCYRENEAAILIIAQPDERVMHLLLERKVAGFGATYGSTHDEAIARLSLIPAVMSLRGLKVDLENNCLILPDGSQVKEGEKLVLDGNSGWLLRSEHDQPVLVHRTIHIVPHGIDGYALENMTRQRLKSASYEELLVEHSRLAEQTKQKRKIAKEQGKEISPEIARLELETHFVHFMIAEKGQEQGLTETQIRLDVARKDGNLDRVPGFEKEGYVLGRSYRIESEPPSRIDEINQRVFGIAPPNRSRRINEIVLVTLIILDEPARRSSELELQKYEAEQRRLNELINILQAQKIPARLYVDSKIINTATGRVHGGDQLFLGLCFPEEQLEQVIRILGEKN